MFCGGVSPQQRGNANIWLMSVCLGNSENFTLIIESIKWAFKHTERNIAETGLNTLLELLTNVQQSQVANAFYQAYYLGLLQVTAYPFCLSCCPVCIGPTISWCAG